MTHAHLAIQLIMSPRIPPRHFQLLLLCFFSCTQAVFNENDFEKVTVGAYYYPWYGQDFHRRAGYLRKEIGHIPALGEYDDSTQPVVQQHLAYSRQANINLWVTSWWGRYSIEDNTTRTVILPAIEGSEHKVAVLYETTGRLNEEDGTRRTSRVIDDIEYIIENYVDHPNYYKIRDRPVIFIYLVSNPSITFMSVALVGSLILCNGCFTRRECSTMIWLLSS